VGKPTDRIAALEAEVKQLREDVNRVMGRSNPIDTSETPAQSKALDKIEKIIDED
jgi:hypothetical protein